MEESDIHSKTLVKQLQCTSFASASLIENIHIVQRPLFLSEPNPLELTYRRGEASNNRRLCNVCQDRNEAVEGEEVSELWQSFAVEIQKYANSRSKTEDTQTAGGHLPQPGILREYTFCCMHMTGTGVGLRRDCRTWS